ncbi:mannosyltransferase [Fulvivirga lutimaris]|uniref:mannosyltransferase n=1 Tax=Fulvivirga lutimaris TaxID=1819566 RepID=UPI0012BBDCB6|nr:mannosyltransferase [Fulvivirga lutimaris]MTI39962.1 mannosyltransferase [Fulvivirga lutimaris]
MPERVSLNKLWPVFAVSAILYFYFSYFLERTQTYHISIVYTTLFGVYLWVVYREWEAKDLLVLIYSAIAFRVLLLASFPNLSDDIYRFVWDGKLIGAGINPFAYLPSHYIENNISVDGLTAELYGKLNSPNYFTIYPPFAQFLFWVGAAPTNSILVSAGIIRLFIILAEIGSIFIGVKLLRQWKLPEANILIYALNPLIILELTGNLHFEAFMIFFLVAAIYFLKQSKLLNSAGFLALSVAAKLLPLMLLPALLKKMKVKKTVILYALTGLFIVILFTPLLNSEFINGMRESIGLYFQKFEFNGSIYYLVREYGYWDRGYNIIETAGRDLALYSLLGILIISIFYPRKLSIAYPWLLLLTFYLLMSTTVHPWYISSLVMLSIFTKYRYAVLWSFLIFFTYAGYTADGFKEQLWITVVEYVAVFGFMAYEIFGKYRWNLNYENENH